MQTWVQLAKVSLIDDKVGGAWFRNGTGQEAPPAREISWLVLTLAGFAMLVALLWAKG